MREELQNNHSSGILRISYYLIFLIVCHLVANFVALQKIWRMNPSQSLLCVVLIFHRCMGYSSFLPSSRNIHDRWNGHFPFWCICIYYSMSLCFCVMKYDPAWVYPAFCPLTNGGRHLYHTMIIWILFIYLFIYLLIFNKYIFNFYKPKQSIAVPLPQQQWYSQYTYGCRHPYRVGFMFSN